MIEKSRKLFKRFIHSRIIYNMLNEEALMKYLCKDDNVIKETLNVFKNGEAWPKKQTK